MEARADGWDLVLRGGRVIDPESGLDAVRDVAVADGRIAAVGTGLTAQVTRGDVDVAGQVVTAGFIDLHSHVSDLGGLRLQALDGVTTALELEAGVTPVAQAYRRAAEQGRPINYGFAASWALARMEAVAGRPPRPAWRVHGQDLGSGLAAAGDPAQVGACWPGSRRTWPTGALGIGVLLGYAPAASPAEYLRVAGARGRRRACRRSPTRASSSRWARPPWPTAPRRSCGPPPRPAPTCTTATSTAPRSGTSTGCSALVARAPGRRVAGHHRGVPVRLGDDRHRRGVPRAGAARRAGPVAVLAHLRATGERVAERGHGCASCAQADPGGLVIIDLLREDDPADRRC